MVSVLLFAIILFSELGRYRTDRYDLRRYKQGA